MGKGCNEVMEPAANLLILGASVRAAAFSALRAGFTPWCADLFADADLRARCQVHRLTGRYPEGFLELFEGCDFPGPWLYTGALENHPDLVGRLARQRPLLGNGPEVLAKVRDPFYLAACARNAGLPAPALTQSPSSSGRWLVKPLHGAAGMGIHPWEPHNPPPTRPSYFQEFIDGQPAAALFVGDGQSARWLGLTWQLVGETWLGAGPFRYCGSIGPVVPDVTMREGLERLGDVLAADAGLRGIFGIDGVVNEGQFWPVEVNPRYTASVEVLEYATGLKALAAHVEACRPGGLARRAPDLTREADRQGVVGKGILFARRGFTFPATGPWLSTVKQPPPVELMPDFADIPEPGEPVVAGHPVLSFLVRAAEVETCRRALQVVAARLEGHLEGRGEGTNMAPNGGNA